MQLQKAVGFGEGCDVIANNEESMAGFFYRGRKDRTQSLSQMIPLSIVWVIKNIQE